MKRIILGFLFYLLFTSIIIAQINNFNQLGKATQEMKTDGLSIAHTSLPINSKVMVLNTATGKELEATVIGRIQASGSRIADLSPSIWRELALNPDPDIRIYTPAAPRPRNTPIVAASPVTEPASAPEPNPVAAAPVAASPAVPVSDPSTVQGLTQTAPKPDANGAAALPMNLSVNVYVTTPEEKHSPSVSNSYMPPSYNTNTDFMAWLYAMDTRDSREARETREAREAQEYKLAIESKDSRINTPPVYPQQTPVIQTAPAVPPAPYPPPAQPPPSYQVPPYQVPVTPKDQLLQEQYAVPSASYPPPVQPTPSYQVPPYQAPSYQVPVAPKDQILQEQYAAPPASQYSPPVQPPPSNQVPSYQVPAAPKDQLPPEQYSNVQVSPGLPNPNNGKIYQLQVGAFYSAEGAAKIAQIVRAAGFNVIQEMHGSLHRVVVANIPASMVHSVVLRLGNIGIKQVWIREK
jgi:hypothetical protein